MSVSNLNNVHLTDEQITAVNNVLQALEQAMMPLQVNLTSEDRHRYGRVNEQNKLFINKVNDFATIQPNLKSPDVDWEEFAKDFKSRNFFEGVINRLNSLVTRANNSKILHDYDNYYEALEDYSYTSFRARSKSVGYEEKYRELKQFFAKKSKTAAPKGENATKTDSE